MTRCPTCQRHFFAGEPDCPFCRKGAAEPGNGLKRVAAAGAVAVMLTGCVPKPTIVAPYGAPPPPTASPVAPTPSPTMTPPALPYGPPPPPSPPPIPVSPAASPSP